MLNAFQGPDVIKVLRPSGRTLHDDQVIDRHHWNSDRLDGHDRLIPIGLRKRNRAFQKKIDLLVLNLRMNEGKSDQSLRLFPVFPRRGRQQFLRIQKTSR